MALPSPMGLCRAQTSGGRLCERFFLTKAMLESLEKGVRRTKGVKNKQKKTAQMCGLQKNSIFV